MNTLEEVGPSKLLEPEQQRIRYAADNLIFSTDLNRDLEARAALEDIQSLCRALVASGRWEQAPATRLIEDVSHCGPAVPAIFRAA